MAAHRFDVLEARLKAAGVGCTEVLPLERVLDAPQAHQPGKLRDVAYRGYDFDVPEFPRIDAARDGIATLPPPELGEHTLALLAAAGVSPQECAAWLAAGAVAAAAPGDFAWAPVRRES